jgi:hypothetical protein
MGNQSCEEKPKTEEDSARQLRRRVQLGRLDAPPITLPSGGGNFNFAFAANLQLHGVLNRTKAFSTATIDPFKVYVPEGLNPQETNNFYRCEFQEAVPTTVQIQDGTGQYRLATSSPSAACMVTMPQAIITGGILSLELVSQTGASFGLMNLFEFGFEQARSELRLEMLAEHPLIRGGNYTSSGRMVLATTSVRTYQRQQKFEGKLGLEKFSLGLSHYFASPLSKVTEEALTQGVQDLAKAWKQGDEWWATVHKSCDKYIYINAGGQMDAGLKEGDIVAIYNTMYHWTGKPCESQLISENKHTSISGDTSRMAPLAYARVTSVGLTISAAAIIENDPNYPRQDRQIFPGARVYMKKMVEPPATPQDSNNPPRSGASRRS